MIQKNKIATKLAILLTTATTLLADFSTSNVQILYSGHFKGNSYVYDTKDGKKTTLTVEHFREFGYGDVFWFADITKGSSFEGQGTLAYSEISPRVSLSKISGKSLAFGFVKDVYLSGQYNAGKAYQAWLTGGGVELAVPFVPVFGVNVYDKKQNVAGKHQTQTTINYKTQEFYGFHATGFHDITDEDYSTQNQLLYNIGAHFGQKGIYAGVEQLHYRHNGGQKTDAVQAMLKWSW